MNRSAGEVHEHVVVRILQCEASDDGCATILDLDTNTGPMRLRLARPFLHTLIGAAATAQLAPAAGSAFSDTGDVPPIVRFLTAVQRPLASESEGK
ncbi:MAG: hypothetical protein DIU74_002565 [Pseudomonadota bacterium]|nr:MAG: hypothetical protein DIU74_07305 [Pseudomonadota bacterium]